MLSQTADYAIRAVEFLARHPGQSFTVDTVARDTTIPRDYLAKVMKLLARADIIRSKRGLHGGFSLDPEALNLTVLDVVNAIDPVKQVHRCPKERESRCEELCPLHSRLSQAIEAFTSSLGNISLAEAAGERMAEIESA